MMGTGILAVSVRLLMDPDFSHLLFQGNGNHSSGHVLIAAGGLMTVVGLIGSIGAWRESPCLLGSVSDGRWDCLSKHCPDIECLSISLFSVSLLCTFTPHGRAHPRHSALLENEQFSRTRSFQHLLGRSAALRQRCDQYDHHGLSSANSWETFHLRNKNELIDWLIGGCCSGNAADWIPTRAGPIPCSAKCTCPREPNQPIYSSCQNPVASIRNPILANKFTSKAFTARPILLLTSCTRRFFFLFFLFPSRLELFQLVSCC